MAIATKFPKFSKIYSQMNTKAEEISLKQVDTILSNDTSSLPNNADNIVWKTT